MKHVYALMVNLGDIRAILYKHTNHFDVAVECSEMECGKAIVTTAR